MCAIAKNISEKGTPNHILVNRIMDYPIDHFIYYTELVELEMRERGYHPKWDNFEKYGLMPQDGRIKCGNKILFSEWHNDRYLEQCVKNLEEKYDCGGISEDEWMVVKDATERHD